MSEPTASRLTAEGLDLGSERLPLHAASVHYWRLERRAWRPCLEAVRALGFRIVDLYIPWSVHERGPGQLDLGEHDERLDVEAFLGLIGELGMKAIVRPGPHINAELTYFGIPERIIWAPECQARSPRGNPVVLPMLPMAFPVPSYASEAFHREVAGYFQKLGPRLAPLLHPRGPIVMVQIDNEGALYFRDGAYDQDYHPDAIALYRRFLAEKYGDEAACGYVGEGKTFSQIEPPRGFDAQHADELPRHLDWVEFHEHLLAWSMKRLRGELEAAGVAGVPFSHNLPPGQEATPLNPAKLRSSVDLVGLDYYHKADPLQRRIIARRTTELVVRSDGLGAPPYAAEMGAGFPPFFPPLGVGDSEFTLLCALAYGLRGFNLYMAVGRDRWVGGPLNSQGKRRPGAVFYEKLLGALDRLRFPSLRRAAPVRLVTPRSLRRLTRVMHAFGPATGAFFSVVGAGARERCFEAELGLGGPVALEGDSFLQAFEQALEGRGVPFAHAGGEDSDVALDGARWVVCATTGGLKPALLDRLRQMAARGVRVSIGPRAPSRDGAMRPLQQPPTLDGIELIAPASGPWLSPSEADRLVGHAIDALGLPTHACDPDGIFACIHEDSGGAPRAVFVINPGGDDTVARVGVPGAKRAFDAFDDRPIEAPHGAFELRMRPRSVRLLRLEA